MKRIFITAIGGDIGYGLIKALKSSHHESFIIGCDIHKYNYSFDEVDEFYVSPPYRDEKVWLDFVLNIIKNKEIDYFWPVTEPEIKIVDQNRELFGKCNIVINTTNLLDVALDKGKTASVLSNANINTPITWYSLNGCDKVFPKVVKEKFGCGSHGVQIVNDIDELIDVYNSMEAPIVQQYVGKADEEYTMTIFSDGEIINSIAFKRILGFGGMSRFVELVHDEAIEHVAKKIANVFNLRGSINVQMRKDGEIFYVFEINPRISSTIGFRLKLGFNDASWWLDMFEKNPIEHYSAPKENVYGVRNVEEKMFYE